MKKSVKLLTSLLFGTISILSIPIMLTAVSCASNMSKSEQVFENVKNNILNKAKASWTLPSEVNEANLTSFLNLNQFKRAMNKGYELTPPILLKDKQGNIVHNDNNGTIKVSIELFKGNEIIQKEVNLEGFLTTKQNKLNNKITAINKLNIKNNDGSLFSKVSKNIDGSNPSYAATKNKTIRQLLNENDPISSKLLEIDKMDGIEIIGLDSIGEPVYLNGVLLPFISKNLRIKLTQDNIISSPFKLTIQGFDKSLSKKSVTQLIHNGVMINPDVAKFLFASEINDEIASATSQNKTTLFNQDLSNRPNLKLFSNYKDISIKYKSGSLKNFNDINGSIQATFIIDMDKNNPGTQSQFEVTTTIYGFVLGINDKIPVFSEIKPYISENNLNITIEGCNLSDDITKYNFEYLNDNGQWVTSNDWKLSEDSNDNIIDINKNNSQSKYIKLTFKKPFDSKELTNEIKVSLVNNKEMSLESSYEIRVPLKLKNSFVSAKDFNLENITANNAMKEISNAWILKNKNVLFEENSTLLLNNLDDIVINSIKIGNNAINENWTNRLISLFVDFTIKAGSSYNSNGQFTTESTNFTLEIQNFSDK